MKKWTHIKIIGAFLMVLSLVSFYKVDIEDSKTVKCLMQVKNYSGEGAYFVVSLITPNGAYEKTLYVQGRDEKWYDTLEQWWDQQGKKTSNIDAISGATIGSGGRTIITLDFPVDKIDAGYSVRFESAVEDQEYYLKDVEFQLNTENLNNQFTGKGYLRYIRLKG